METKEIPVSVYASATPNPQTMKFVANKLLIENGAVVEYTEPEQTEYSPLAAKLFNFSFIEGVFIADNFVSITKSDVVEWSDIQLEMREFVQDFLRSGAKAVMGNPADQAEEDSTVAETLISTEVAEVEPETEIEKKIVEVLEDYVKPAVQQDGGAIHYKSFEEDSGKLTVILKGACSGCPSSTVTLKNGIQGLMEKMVPEVTEVVAEEH